jgi:hypothetical protein
MRPLNITIILVALAITCVVIAVTASAINAIAIGEIKTEAQQYNLTHGSAAKPRGSEPGYGVRVAVPPGQKAFPAELVPVD